MTATLSTMRSFSSAASVRSSSAVGKETLAESEVAEDDHHQEEREQEQHADDVDGGLDPLVHLAPGDQLDAEEHESPAVERGNGQEIEEREAHRDDGDHLGEVGDAPLHLGGGLLDDGDGPRE